MPELTVATNLACLTPPVLFQLSDDVPHLHGANVSTACNGTLTAVLALPPARPAPGRRPPQSVPERTPRPLRQALRVGRPRPAQQSRHRERRYAPTVGGGAVPVACPVQTHGRCLSRASASRMTFSAASASSGEYAVVDRQRFGDGRHSQVIGQDHYVVQIATSARGRVGEQGLTHVDANSASSMYMPRRRKAAGERAPSEAVGRRRTLTHQRARSDSGAARNSSRNSMTRRKRVESS